MSAPKAPKVCGALVHHPESSKTDMCLKEAGHDESLTPTAHLGDRFGMSWRTYVDDQGKRRKEILDIGRPFEDEEARRVGGTERHQIDVETATQSEQYRKHAGEAAAA